MIIFLICKDICIANKSSKIVMHYKKIFIKKIISNLSDYLEMIKWEDQNER